MRSLVKMHKVQKGMEVRTVGARRTLISGLLHLFILGFFFALAEPAEAAVKYWIGGTAGKFHDNTR